MIAACGHVHAVSGLLLTYHYQVGSVRFPPAGVRPPALLHNPDYTCDIGRIGAAARDHTLSRGLRGRFDRHRAIARWTLPIWLYVSVTGVLVYVLLYQPTWLI